MILGMVLLTALCTTRNRISVAPSTHVSSHVPSSTPTPSSPIRTIDFANVTYPNFPDYSDPNGREKRHITLNAGEASPTFINYGDVTGDGVEDALVVLAIDNHGSAIPHYVYIFVAEEKKPRLIWDFETGDRADGGLRNIYAENGQLVIELFGKDRAIGDELYRGEEGLCCPSSFTKTNYRWAGTRFEEIRRELVKNPTGGADPVMPHASPAN